MRLIAKTYWNGTWIKFREPVEDFADCRQVTAYANDGGQSRGLYWTPKSNPRPRVAVVAGHPRVDFSRHYLFPQLLRAGYACLGANVRTTGNDMTCIHEQIILDIAAQVQWLKDECGVEQVIWLGNSGGGSLGGFYQAQAQLPSAERLAMTPGGRPTTLRSAVMPTFDAMIMLAAHSGQGLILNETIDPAVVDEHAPLLTDASLDMYDPANGFRPAPEWSRYTPEFQQRYRAAQLARVARLDAQARAMIADQREAELTSAAPGFSSLALAQQRTILQRAAFQPVMTIYRTMANLHYTDNSIDPSNRGYGSLLSDRPDLMNFQLLGFARVLTPDAWLSTWSGLSSNANLLKNAPSIKVPMIFVHAGRDLDCYLNTHSRPIFDAFGSDDKTFVEFADQLHYFEPDEGQDDNAGALAQAAKVVPWLKERAPL
ncbi:MULTISPECIES: alpha/beta fold hydrolase [unclassified Paraburkholderia]|uniref:alpha/beta fold hydrolase n=1 Tax=unclassified Paraburkholderia TaxID=2615204 RepID=UPI002AB15C47|nr:MULTISPECIES: alpha/beta fold hydrolase [unclassified Paraburkholderia]